MSLGAEAPRQEGTPSPGRAPVGGPDLEEGRFERRALLMVVSALLIAAVVGHFLAVLWHTRAAAATLALAGIPLAAALLLVQRGRLQAAGRLSLATALALVTRLMYVGEGTADIVVIAWPALVLAAALLLGRRDLYVFVAAAIAGSGMVVWLVPVGSVEIPYSWRTSLLELSVLALVMILTAVVADVLILNLRRSLSESLASERALRASEELFHRAFHASPAAMSITRLSDRSVVDVNESFLRATGRRGDGMVGLPIPETGPWIDPSGREALYRALDERGAFDDLQVEYRREGGDAGQALVSGAVVEIAGERCALFTALDVTERLIAERALAESEERYRLISRLISDYTFSTRVAEDGSLHLEWVAGAFERITGYTFDEYLARGGWRSTLHPDDLEVDDRALERIRSRKAVENEVRTLAPDGSLRWVRVYGHPVWDEARDRLVRIHGAVKDITDQKQAELDRETLIRELEAKNEELERFTYTASHDLKSPLLTVRGFLGHVVAAVEEGDREAALADLDRVGDAAARMGRLLDELLELSRIGRVVRPPVDTPFDEVVREALILCQGRLDSRGARVAVQDGLPSVLGDRTRLVEVMQNLVDNAVKFTPEDRSPQIEIGAHGEAAGAVFFVADQGVGLAPEHRERIFGLFDKLDPDSEGTGIGLALVERIVRLHGGVAWAESDGPGRGSRFCFTLPGDPAASAADRSA